jgi:hypothetical protein
VRKDTDGRLYESVKEWSSGSPEVKGDLFKEVDQILSALSAANRNSSNSDSSARTAVSEKITRMQAGDRFEGLQGRTHVRWQHEGVEHSAVIVSNGEYGTARVRCTVPDVGFVEAEQDLSLARNENGTFYVGSNVRLPGTNLPHPVYTPDIFRLSRRPNGAWTITEVGTDWDHFDEAIARFN